MNATTHPVAPIAATRDDRDVRFAWACLWSTPVVFVLTFVLGYGLSAVLGVEDGEMASVGAGVLLLLMVAALFAIPTGLAWRFANRARARGDDRGRVPAIAVTVLAVAVVGVNLLQWVIGLVIEVG